MPTNTNQIDLRECSPGQKLRSRQGEIFTYVSHNQEKFYPHLVKNARGYFESRNDDGTTFKRNNKPEDQDIVEILSNEEEISPFAHVGGIFSESAIEFFNEVGKKQTQLTDDFYGISFKDFDADEFSRNLEQALEVFKKPVFFFKAWKWNNDGNAMSFFVPIKIDRGQIVGYYIAVGITIIKQHGPCVSITVQWMERQELVNDHVLEVQSMISASMNVNENVYPDDGHDAEGSFLS